MAKDRDQYGTDQIELLSSELAQVRAEHATLLRQQRELDSRLFDFRSLLRASRALHHCREIGELARILSAMIQERLPVEGLWLFLRQPDTDRFELWIDGAPANSDPFSFALPPGILWQLLSQGTPFSVVDLDGRFRFDDLFHSSGLDRFPTSEWLPLAMENQPAGIVTLGRRKDGKPFTDREREFLGTVGEQASVAVSSVMLYGKLESEQAKLDRTIRNLSVLYDISRSIGQIDNMKGLLLQILEKAIERVGAQKGSIMLHDHLDGVLRLQVVRGLPDRLLEERINNGEQQCKTFRPGEGIAGTVFQSGEPYITNNTSKDKRYASHAGSNVESIICLPLMSHDDPIGVLNITNKVGGQFDDDDIEILTAIAAQAAMTIEKADLYRLAITDELTGLYVRRYFFRRLDEEYKRSRRYGTKLSAAMLDIDHFKVFNDTHGHEVGDLVLKHVSALLVQQCREIDLVARIGGEEFAVLFTETPLAGALIAAERLRKTIANTPIDHDGLALAVTASIGVTELTPHVEHAEALMRNADVALYRAKDAGRDRVVAFEPGMTHPGGDD